MKLNRKSLLLIITAIFIMVSGVWGGLLRLGWSLPLIKSQLIIFHGPLMLCGFLGTLVCLERAVAIDKKWSFIAPILTGLGSVVIIFGFSPIIGQILILLGSLILLFIFISILRKQFSIHSLIMTIGVFSWIFGNLLWIIGIPVSHLVFWWITFVLLTITGERLELARLGNISENSKIELLLFVFLIFSALFISFYSTDIGIRIFGSGLIFITFWLAKNDIARHTIKSKGITKYIAFCLLSGYFWLLINGIIALFLGSSLIETLFYDSFLHSFFLGFTLSMIFGHAPIILPAILKINLAFKNRFYFPIIFLHLSLTLRIFAVLIDNTVTLKTAGLLNVLTILIFFLNILISIRGSKRNISEIKLVKSI